MSLRSNLRRYHTHFQSYQIRHNEDSIWFLATQNDDFQPLQILPSSVVTSWLIVLHFRLENGKRQTLLILNDALNASDYRALAVTLKIAGLPQDEV